MVHTGHVCAGYTGECHSSVFASPASPVAALSSASDYGSPLEVEQNGMLRAAFAEDGKMNELEMMFDGIAVHQQLQMAMGVRKKKKSPRKIGHFVSYISCTHGLPGKSEGQTEKAAKGRWM